jgi:hypothetical protein
VERPFCHKVVSEHEDFSPGWDRTVLNTAFHCKDLIIELTPFGGVARCLPIPAPKNTLTSGCPMSQRDCPKPMLDASPTMNPAAVMAVGRT